PPKVTTIVRRSGFLTPAPRWANRLRGSHQSAMQAAMIRSASRRRQVMARIISACGAAGDGSPHKRLSRHDAAPFADDDQLIRAGALDRLPRAARPGHFDPLGAGARSEADEDPQIVLRAEAAAAADLVDQLAAGDLNRDPRADRAAVRSRAFELHLQTVVRWCGAIAQQRRAIVHIVDDDVLLAGVEQVAERGAARRALRQQTR